LVLYQNTAHFSSKKSFFWPRWAVGGSRDLSLLIKDGFLGGKGSNKLQNYVKTLPNVAKLCKTLQNVAKLIQNVAKCLKKLQKIAKYSRTCRI